jgi:hypothetical protein
MNKNKKISSFKEFNNKQLKESATFKVGDVFKVKSTFDVPISLVKDYISKVKEETSKNPLDNFSHTEIAEELIKHIVSSNLDISNMPSTITVGESSIESDIERETSNKKRDEFDGEELEFDIEDEMNFNEKEEGDDNEIEFSIEEADLDEDIELESEEK